MAASSGMSKSRSDLLNYEQVVVKVGVEWEVYASADVYSWLCASTDYRAGVWA